METGFLYAIGAAVAWGLVYTIDQKILESTTPTTLLFLNAIVTAIIMLPFVFSDTGSMKALLSSGKNNLSLVFITIILGALASFLIFSSIKKLDASIASIIEVSYPFFVVLFSYVFLNTTPNLYFFIGGVLVFIGSVIIVRFA